MKKKALLAAAALAALMVPQVAGAEGFGIVQWSAAGVAMGGARMFAENDVSMVAANPASLTKFEGKGLGINATYISPHGSYDISANPGVMGPNSRVIESGKNRIHPGIVPGTYYVKQMNEKDWFGIGAYTRYGMISGFQHGTFAAVDNYFSKMNGLSITPVYAHKFDKKWSAAVGAEVNYVGLELNKNATKLAELGSVPGIGSAMLEAAALGDAHIKGETYALGWNAAVNYSFDDKNEVGLVYRSRVKHSLEADFHGYRAAGGNYTLSGDAYGVVTLPDQWTIGYNHKFDKKNRIELNATRTNWHTYDALNIHLSNLKLNGVVPVANKPLDSPKNWSDTWRYAIGYEHKFSEKYTGMLGFAFDDHAIPFDGGDSIVPTGLRRTYSVGLQYNDKKHTVAAAIAWEDIGSLNYDFLGKGVATAHTHDNFCKIFSIGYQYKF